MTLRVNLINETLRYIPSLHSPWREGTRASKNKYISTWVTSEAANRNAHNYTYTLYSLLNPQVPHSHMRNTLLFVPTSTLESHSKLSYSQLGYRQHNDISRTLHAHK